MNGKGFVFFIGMTLLSGLLQANEKQSIEKQGLLISDDIKSMLHDEMHYIEEGMQKMLPLIAAGEWLQVSAIAKNIEHGFILKQTLTESQRHELHESLPTGFIAMDKAFHKAAGMMAHVAEEGHIELVSFYYYKMQEACISCHSNYAQQRFPAFVTQQQHMQKDHH